jgi:DNA-binding MarR family transcriptional regulator
MDAHHTDPAAQYDLRRDAEDLADSVTAVTEISVGVAAAVDPRLLPYRLRVLMVVTERPGINLTALAKAIRVGLPRASRVCSGMERAGLLARGSNGHSRREIGLWATARGVAVLEDYRARWADLLTDVMRLTPAADRGDLLTGLRSLASSLRAVTERRG